MGGAAVLRPVDVLHVEPPIILESPFDRLVNAVAAHCRRLSILAQPVATLLVFWGSVRLGFNGFKHNPVDYARGVNRPVLILHGTEDQEVSRAQIEALHANLAGEKAVHYFDGLGHDFSVAERTDEWKRQVRAFCSVQAEVVVLKAS